VNDDVNSMGARPDRAWFRAIAASWVALRGFGRAARARSVSVVATAKDRGASVVEYALLLALIALVCVSAVQFLGGTQSQKFSRIGSAVCQPLLDGSGC
jgi:Flp pilus assembly pilin Flp